MVNALILAALVLSAFIIATATLEHDRARLALASRVMAWLTLAAAVALPLMVLATYLAPHEMRPLNLRLYHLSAGRNFSAAVPIGDRMLAFACAAVPLSIAVWGLLTLRQLFEAFAAREVFSHETSATLRSLSLALFAFVVTAFAAEAPISYFLLRHDPNRTYTFALNIGLEDLVALFAAAVAAVIARVMSEAARVADENAKFV
jgi:Protein of unknown function (DUF2975)